jgi:hypothetical protein
MAISFGGFEMKNTSVMMVTGVLLLGCASVDSVRDAPTSKGEERIFEVGYKRMVDVVSTTLPQALEFTGATNFGMGSSVLHPTGRKMFLPVSRNGYHELGLPFIIC